jgi:hypothetical protein
MQQYYVVITIATLFSHEKYIKTQTATTLETTTI